MNKQIGTNIKKIRKSLDISQKEMADHLGVANTTVSSWETNRTEPDMAMALRICTYLKCGLEDIAGGNEKDVFYLTETEKEIIRRFRTSRHQDAILSLLDMK